MWKAQLKAIDFPSISNDDNSISRFIFQTLGCQTGNKNRNDNQHFNH